MTEDPQDSYILALIRRVQSGELAAHDAAFELTELYEPLVKGVMAALRVPRWEVEDAHQAGRLGLLRALQTYDPQRGISFGAYARFPVMRAIRDVRRAGRDAPTSYVAQEQCTKITRGNASRRFETAPETAMVDAQTERIVDEFLLSGTLTERERSAVIDRYWHKLPGRATAARLGISQQAVSKALKRALCKARGNPRIASLREMNAKQGDSDGSEDPSRLGYPVREAA